MVNGELHQNKHPLLSDLSQQLQVLSTGDLVDLFGGEPTIYPKFMDILQLAVDKKLNVSIASNCRRMADTHLVEHLAQIPSLSVRTSLYGATADIHDYYTRREGSFDETISGISNLVRYGISPLVNILLLPENHRHLLEMVSLLALHGVHNLKLSLVYGGKDMKYYIIPLQEVRSSIMKTVDFMCQKGFRLQIEKSPFCLAPPLLHAFIHESDPEMERSCKQHYTHLPVCESCCLKPICRGVLQTYAHIHSEDGLLPFPTIPEHSIRRIQPTEFKGYEPRTPTEFIEIISDEGWFDTGEIEILTEFLIDLNRRFPQTHVVEGTRLACENL